ncbi:MAG: DUF167 domain-containing protein [Anaerolineae bacterium]|nr:DUF167 domain-containing protein [Anaerolineae bacterium]
MRKKFEIKNAVGGAAFSVRVVTRAARAEIAGIQEDGVLKIRLTSSPVEGDAVNEELLAFLAERLRVPVSAIELVAGQKGREKLISVDGIQPADLEERLAPDPAE